MTNSLSAHHTPLRGQALLNDPILNKGLGFTRQERDSLGLHGLLPVAERTLTEQVKLTAKALAAIENPLDKHIYLRTLQDTNETLFYALLEHDLETALPLVYTPTVGQACQTFSEIWRRPRGLFLAYPDRDRLDTILADKRFDKTKVIVVSDGERILGLGDLGAGGMGIPIGKLSLYTGCAGIHPHETLPILLDTGTDNETLRNDPTYIGWKHARIRGEDYDNFVERFVQAVKHRFPNVLLQWEDFAGRNAAPLLAKYRNQLCTFNDDIQGTAAVAAGAILAAAQAAQKSGAGGLRDQVIVILGGGSAGCGIGALLRQAMLDEGIPETELHKHFYMVDRPGLLLTTTPDLTEGQKPFAQNPDHVATWAKDGRTGLHEVVENANATILIGVSGQPGLFDEPIIRSLAKHTKRPIVFPLSNPTSRCEATPEDVLTWSDGRALVSTGSPFPPLTIDGKKQRVDQTNNAYIFPGIGLGILAVGAKRVTETMFMAAAKALAAESPLVKGEGPNLLPPVADLHKVALGVARAVAIQARQDGVAEPFDEARLDDLIAAHVWHPRYLPTHPA